MSRLLEKASTGPVNREARGAATPRRLSDSGLLLLCCDRPMQPRLAQAHDWSGKLLFVTLWSCSQCGKSLF